MAAWDELSKGTGAAATATSWRRKRYAYSQAM